MTLLNICKESNISRSERKRNTYSFEPVHKEEWNIVGFMEKEYGKPMRREFTMEFRNSALSDK